MMFFKVSILSETPQSFQQNIIIFFNIYIFLILIIVSLAENAHLVSLEGSCDTGVMAAEKKSAFRHRNKLL